MPNRYCRAFTSHYPFDAGAELVYTPTSRRAEKTPSDVATLVQSCNRFRTFAEHSSSLRNGLSESEAQIIEKLRLHAATGLLISEEEFIADCKRTANPEGNPPRIASIGATTRNRPALLRRGLESFIDNARCNSRSHDYIVVDDGTTEETSSTKSALEELAQEREVTIRYAGRAARHAFAEGLAAEAGVAPEVVRFALLGDAASSITTGAARNSLLLDTVGDAYLLVDDDSVCRVAPCPDHLPGLALDSRTNPTELWFYRDRDAMLRDTAFAEQDPLAAHEEILGRQVADCLPPASQAADVDFTYTSADFAEQLWSHPGRVLATSGGVVGDSGMGSTAYLALPRDSQARLVRSEQGYISAVQNRQILRAPLRTTISRGTFCVGASLGLDNRVLLPPFVPVQRNSDGLFARTLLRCFRDGYKGYLAWAVLHDPLPPRAQSIEGAEADAVRIRLTHILRALIVPAEFTQSGDPGLDMRRLGEEMIEIASQRPEDFRHTIKPRIVKSAALYLEGIQQTMRPEVAAEFYTRRQKAYWQRLAEALTTEEYFLPRDLANSDGAEEPLRAAQRVVLQFGRLLRDWTAIVAAAKVLRARGERLAKPV
ncbi:MAG: hypothetical protein WD733_19685 [Bryobacterales bacterium]